MCALQLSALVLGPLQTNCYFLTNGGTKETIIVDPADEFAKIHEKCRTLNIKPIAVFLTHGHFDHIAAVEYVKNAWEIPVYAGAAEKGLLRDARINGSAMINMDISFTADKWVSDGELLYIAGFEIKVIGAPGHTAGSVCYYFEDGDILISGDTLFRDSFGRTDLPTGDFSMLASSIKRKLFPLPDITVVYPGHGVKTTIAYEKKNNLILRHPDSL